MGSNLYYNYWDYWNLYHKVTFDGPNKIIWVNPGVTELNVKEDIYSDWKEWMLGHDSVITALYIEASEAIGGQPLPGSRFVGSTFFLANGWRIKPYSGSYTLVVNGNLYTTEGDSPYLDADGSLNNIRIESTVSTLVETVGVTEVQSAQSLTDIANEVWTATLSAIASGSNAAARVEDIKRLVALIPAAL